MPRKVEANEALKTKWNMYVNDIEKLEYLAALVKSGKSRCQSAGVRAFMYLYVHDEEVRNKVNTIIDDFIVYKDNGDASRL